ncbi:MAG: tyrosine--tRNA ligase [Bdellovibrionota bacterium]|jgi:tyrosyl-tRNA synthetase
MNIIDELEWRGLIQDISDRDGIRQLPEQTVFYVGFDPTAPSLQLGNLVPIMVATRLGRAGFKPMILFGGATGAIGDPSGKSKERPLLSRETIDKNIAAQKKKVVEIFSRVGLEAEFINNFEWTRDMPIIDFLRDVGKYFTINYMLAKDVIKSRLSGEGLSYTEFSYVLLQAFDFFHLYQTKNCRLQIGGSEQWGNITAGLELIRKRVQGDAYGFCFPLITDSQGQKFGKSAGNALWLDGEMTSPFKLHQFLLNVTDEDVERLLKIFTFLSKEEIEKLCAEHRTTPEKRLAQHVLADHVCEFIHGKDAVNDANRGAEVLFGGSLDGLTDQVLADIFQDIPSTTCSSSEIAGMSVIDLFVRTGLATSKGEARRLIANGGAYVHGERISDPTMLIRSTTRGVAKFIVLRSGKKNYHTVKVQD